MLSNDDTFVLNTALFLLFVGPGWTLTALVINSLGSRSVHAALVVLQLANIVALPFVGFHVPTAKPDHVVESRLVNVGVLGGEVSPRRFGVQSGASASPLSGGTAPATPPQARLRREGTLFKE